LRKSFPAGRAGVTSISFKWIRKEAENWPGANAFVDLCGEKLLLLT
jgi:hypothetical protein